MRRMNVFNVDGSISAAEWEVARYALYRPFPCLRVTLTFTEQIIHSTYFPER